MKVITSRSVSAAAVLALALTASGLTIPAFAAEETLLQTLEGSTSTAGPLQLRAAKTLPG